MRLWPQSLAARIGLALAAAAVALVWLDAWVADREVAAAGTLPVRSHTPPPGPSLRLAVTTGPILLALRSTAFAADVEPIVQILGDGSVVWRRPAPLATGPRTAASPAPVGVVLPAGDVVAMGPMVRGALVELVGQLVRERPVPVSRFRTVDLTMPRADLERLLAWVP